VLVEERAYDLLSVSSQEVQAGLACCGRQDRCHWFWQLAEEGEAWVVLQEQQEVAAEPLL
jgi:hypothetical protein